MAEIGKTHARGAGICGILILLCGIGNTVCGILWVLKLRELNKDNEEYAAYFYGSGLYSGIPLIIAGALGIAVWPKRSKGIMTAFIVFCIIACILATLQAIGAGVLYSIVHYANCLESNSDCSDLAKFIVTSILVWTILSSVGAIVTFAGSIIGCMSTCCASQASNPGVVVVGQVPMQSYNGPSNDSKF